MKRFKDYHKELLQELKNPKEAVAYLNAALEVADKAAFLMALRNVVEAQGGIGKISRSIKQHRVSLYKMLSEKGNPELESLMMVLKVTGMRFQITTASSSSMRRAA